MRERKVMLDWEGFNLLDLELIMKNAGNSVTAINTRVVLPVPPQIFPLKLRRLQQQIVVSFSVKNVVESH